MREDAIEVALAGTFTMAATLGVDRFIYTSLLPMMQEALRFSAGQAGLIASLLATCGLLVGSRLIAILRGI